MRIWENKLQNMLDCPPLTTTTTQPPTTTTTQPSGYIVPEDFGWVDTYDYLTDYPSDDHEMNLYLDYYPNYFDVGDVITLSTRCTNDFDFNVGRTNVNTLPKCLNDPSTGFNQEDWDGLIRYMCSKDPVDLLQYAMIDPTNPGEYLTLLNCPQCGCTLGQNDAVHIEDDRSTIWQGNSRSSKKYSEFLSEMIPRQRKKSKNIAKGN